MKKLLLLIVITLVICSFLGTTNARQSGLGVTLVYDWQIDEYFKKMLIERFPLMVDYIENHRVIPFSIKNSGDEEQLFCVHEFLVRNGKKPIEASLLLYDSKGKMIEDFCHLVREEGISGFIFIPQRANGTISFFLRRQQASILIDQLEV